MSCCCPGMARGYGIQARTVSPAGTASADPDLWTAIDRNDLAALQAALVAGADPSRPDANGRTALMAAASAGHARIVAALLAAGANPHAVDREGSSALQYARRIADPDSIRLLEQAGAR